MNPPLVMEPETKLVLYAVRNKDGEFFRAKGFGGHGETWVDSLKKARIYSKPGPARAQVTFFANRWPEYGVPELVELRVTEVVTLNEDVRVKKSMNRKEREKAECARRHAEWERDQAEKKLQEAKETLRKLGRAV
jgi:hypothetical protein